MTTFMKIIKKIFGIFFLIMCITSVYLSFTELRKALILSLFLSAIYGYIAKLLLIGKHKKKVVTPCEPTIEQVTTAPITNTIMNKRQIDKERCTANFKYPQYIRVISESITIMYNTDDPSVLCSRYKVAMQKLSELNYYDKQGLLNDSSALMQYNNLLSNENYKKIINSCYNKYFQKAKLELKTEKGIQNRINKFWSTIQSESYS